VGGRCAASRCNTNVFAVCNLYSMTRNVDAIRQLFGGRNSAGNMPSFPGIFPDYAAPVVRNSGDDRKITMMRWGMPTSQRAMMDATKKRAQRLEAKGQQIDFKELLRVEPDGGVTNISSEGDAGDPHDERAMRCLDGRRLGEGFEATAPIAGWIAQDRWERGEGRQRVSFTPSHHSDTSRRADFISPTANRRCPATACRETPA
jgi:hypothetical protein